MPALLTLLGGLALAGDAPDEGRVRFTLDNGLEVVLEPRPHSDSVAVVALIRVGARSETPETSGCAHMLEHMLFTGTEEWSEAELKDVIDRRGGRWNGYTNYERTLYFAHLSAPDLPLALDWVSQVVFHPTLAADQLEKERAVVSQERGGSRGWLVNTATALGFGYELDLGIRQAIFPGSGLDRRVIGEDESLAALDLETLGAFYRTWYVPGNTVLAVVGKLDVVEARALVTSIYGGLPAARVPPQPPPPPEPPPGPHQVIVRGPLPADQVSLRVGARTVGRDHPDHWSLQVFAELLRMELADTLRYERGWAYDLQVVNIPYNDAGYFAVKTQVSGENVTPALEIIDAALARAAAGQLPAGRVADAARATAGRYAIDMESNSSRATDLAQWLSITPSDAPLPDYGARVSAVTAADLQRVAQAWFTPDRRYTGLHKPILTTRSALWLSPLLTLIVGWITWRRLLRRRRARAALEAKLAAAEARSIDSAPSAHCRPDTPDLSA